MDNESNDLDDDDDNKHRAGKNVVAAMKKSQFARKKNSFGLTVACSPSVEIVIKCMQKRSFSRRFISYTTPKNSGKNRPNDKDTHTHTRLVERLFLRPLKSNTIMKSFRNEQNLYFNFENE